MPIEVTRNGFMPKRIVVHSGEAVTLTRLVERTCVTYVVLSLDAETWSSTTFRWARRSQSRPHALGAEFQVIAHHHTRELGEFVILKRWFDGGWQAVPINRVEWTRRQFWILTQ